MKKWICLLAAMLCAAACPVNAAADQRDFNRWFTEEHRQYVESQEYQDIILAVPGGEAGVIADSFEQSALPGINSGWHILDYIMDIVGAEDNLAYEEPVEVVVRTLMVQTLSSDSFMKSLAREAYASTDGFLGALSSALDDPQSGFVKDLALQGSPEQIENLSILVKSAHQLLKAAADAPRDIKLFKSCEDALDMLDAGFKKFFPTGYAAAEATALGLYIDTHQLVSGIGYNVTHAQLRGELLYKAYTAASDEWILFWTRIMEEAKEAVGAGQQGLFAQTDSIVKEIDRVLTEVRQARDSDAAYQFVSEYMGTQWPDLVNVDLTEFVSNMLFNVLPLQYKAIMLMTRATHWVINKLTQMDSVALNGQLAYVSAELTRYAHTVLKEQGEQLRSHPDYRQACHFDSFFQYYKSMMIHTLQYLIDYDSKITDALLFECVDTIRRFNEGYSSRRWSRPPHDYQNKETELELLESMLAIWKVRDCHLHSQLRLIEENVDVWKPGEEEAYAGLYMVAVTDMDADGRLELLVNWSYGNGMASFLKIFEVNDTMTALEECTPDDRTSMPDFLNVTGVPIYEKNGALYMIVPDLNRVGWEYDSECMVITSLQGRQLKLEELGMKETTNYIDKDPDIVYRDASGNEIPEKEYAQLPSKRFPNTIEGEMTFLFVPYNYPEEESLSERLERSWAGFGCEIF